MLLLWPASLTPLGSGSLLEERGLHVPNSYPRMYHHLAQQLLHGKTSTILLETPPSHTNTVRSHRTTEKEDKLNVLISMRLTS